jgi:xylulokinase
VGHDELSRLALDAKPGAGGLVHVPYLEGERTPNLPTTTGSLHGMTVSNLNPANLARAAVEGLLGLLAGGISALGDEGVTVDRVTLVGGAARSEAVRVCAPALLGVPVDVPEPGESVADGAARQAAWVLSGEATPPAWQLHETQRYAAQPDRETLDSYRRAAALVAREAAAAEPV